MQHWLAIWNMLYDQFQFELCPGSLDGADDFVCWPGVQVFIYLQEVSLVTGLSIKQCNFAG